MSYVSALYHIVFSTHSRKPVIENENRAKLYAVIGAEIKMCHSKPIIINGVHNHIHILLDLSPRISLSDLMRNIKSKSSVWAKMSGLFPLFEGWEREYGAFSVSYTHLQPVYDYIKNQQSHHNTTDFEIEYNRLILKAGMQIYQGDNK